METVEKERLNWHGRYLDYQGNRYFDYSASGFSFVFYGKKVVANFLSDSSSFDDNSKAVLGVYVYEGVEDSIESLPKEISKKIILKDDNTSVTLFESETEKRVCIRVIKLSECKYAYCALSSLEIDGCVINSIGNASKVLSMEVIGDSITCGYGIEGDVNGEFSTTEERSDKTYAFEAARRLNAELTCCSWSGIGILSHYVDSDVNIPDTSTLMGEMWPYTDKELSKRFKINPQVISYYKNTLDVVVINIGTNDASYVRGKEERRVIFKAFYKQFLETVYRYYPSAKIICAYGIMEGSLKQTIKEAVDLFSKDFPSAKIMFLDFPLQNEKDGLGTAGHPSFITQKKCGELLANTILKTM